MGPSVRVLAFLPLVLAASLLVACPKESPPPQASAEAEAPPPPPPSRYKGTIKGFVDHLIRTPIRSYKPEVAGDALMRYDELRFESENRWVAKGEIKLGEEPYECEESGTWEVDADAVTSPEEGAVDLVTDKTACPGRKAPMNWRILIRYQGDEAEVINR